MGRFLGLARNGYVDEISTHSTPTHSSLRSSRTVPAANPGWILLTRKYCFPLSGPVRNVCDGRHLIASQRFFAPTSPSTNTNDTPARATESGGKRKMSPAPHDQITNRMFRPRRTATWRSQVPHEEALLINPPPESGPAVTTPNELRSSPKMAAENTAQRIIKNYSKMLGNPQHSSAVSRRIDLPPVHKKGRGRTAPGPCHIG